MGKKDEQLGMPFGTANARLRKMILFNLLKKHGENVCFRCDTHIYTAAELSIEHKEPWLDVDVALFWDVENIAWAHLSCNSGAARHAVAEVCYVCKVNPARPRKPGKSGNITRECRQCNTEQRRRYPRV